MCSRRRHNGISHKNKRWRMKRENIIFKWENKWNISWRKFIKNHNMTWEISFFNFNVMDLRESCRRRDDEAVNLLRFNFHLEMKTSIFNGKFIWYKLQIQHFLKSFFSILLPPQKIPHRKLFSSRHLGRKFSVNAPWRFNKTKSLRIFMNETKKKENKKKWETFLKSFLEVSI